MSQNERLEIKEGGGAVNAFPNEVFFNRYHNAALSIKEMATRIAAGIYQSEKMLDKVYDMVQIASSSGIERTSMQYVAMMAVETAHWIDEYAKHWDVGGEKDGN